MPGRSYFNHQTWENGRNLVRYVPRNQIKPLRRAIEGYHRFQELVEQYALRVIEKSRLERAEIKNSRKKLKTK